MTEEDLNYFRRRAAEEHAAAESAVNEAAAVVHRELKLRYQALTEACTNPFVGSKQTVRSRAMLTFTRVGAVPYAVPGPGALMEKQESGV
jgi:hypothetical protein